MIPAKPSNSPVIGFQIDSLQYEHYKALLIYERERDNLVYNLTVAPYRRRRSDGPYSQNNAFHGNCRQICNATGNSMHTVKEYVMRRAMDEMDYPAEEMGGVMIPKSDADATMTEMSQLITCTEVLAAELGVVLIDG